MSWLDDFMVRAALAGLGVAIAAAPLGCLVVWRRMAYFGDATAHAAILGVALSLALSMNLFVGVLAVALAMGLMVGSLSERRFALDTVLGVLAHAALAVGLVAVSLLSGVRVDLSAYLFGDILAVGRFDLAVIWGGVLIVLGLMWWRWQALLTATLSPELAMAADLDPRRETQILTLALAVVVAVAIKVVGALLIGAMLLIPAAAARSLSNTPEQMALLAAGLGGVSAVGGIQLSAMFDTPSGPTIVCVAATLFAVTSLGGLLKTLVR
ncbi:metal ABC transporter permease [Primorskyibacter sp. S187A]|uniref:metal ABC transporter permease n=1 Tax=Primorskyibacter sp. S187A TaxID=3415130 RepID=UPI003C7AA88F